MLTAMWLPFSGHLYLFTTHITRNKIIAGVAVLVVVVVGLAVWLVRRRTAGARQT